MDLSRYRKLITLVITAAMVVTLHRAGFNANDLWLYGLNVTGLAEPVADFLVTVGIPAVFMAAQPNENGDTLLNNWRWLAGGGLVLAFLIVIAVLVL
jgi:hypothetical protein